MCVKNDEDLNIMGNAPESTVVICDVELVECNVTDLVDMVK